MRIADCPLGSGPFGRKEEETSKEPKQPHSPADFSDRTPHRFAFPWGKGCGQKSQPNSSQQVSQSTWPSSGRTGAFESTRLLPGRSIPRGSNVFRRSRAVPNTWKKLRKPIQWDDSASLKRLPTRFSSWRQTRHHSSLAQFSQSTAGTWLSRAQQPQNPSKVKSAQTGCRSFLNRS